MNFTENERREANSKSRRESLTMTSRPFQFLRECIHKFGVG